MLTSHYNIRWCHIRRKGVIVSVWPLMYLFSVRYKLSQDKERLHFFRESNRSIVSTGLANRRLLWMPNVRLRYTVPQKTSALSNRLLTPKRDHRKYPAGATHSADIASVARSHPTHQHKDQQESLKLIPGSAWTCALILARTMCLHDRKTGHKECFRFSRCSSLVRPGKLSRAKIKWRKNEFPIKVGVQVSYSLT